MNEIINKRINDIIAESGKSIIVLKGFNPDEFPKNRKYFSFKIEFFDTVALDNKLTSIVIDDMIQNRTFEEDYRWMMIEEYQLFKEQSNISKMPVVMLENNLYSKQFPYAGTLSAIDNIYHYLYYQEDSELDAEQEKVLKNVTYFYGRIDYSKQSGNYFVTYPEMEEEVTVYPLYCEKSIQVTIVEDPPVENVQQTELSEDELPFLDLETEIISGRCSHNIVFLLSGNVETLPNSYQERIGILKSLVDIDVYFIVPSIRKKFIENEGDYLSLLKRTYGYDSFRELAFYKNIERQSKATINVSQAQIIDDIVKQAENAIHGDRFRDVYITASTGAGKSVMFQIPALYLANKYKDNKPLTLVISPLIGLMNDQVDTLKKQGISNSATINGNTPPYEKENIIEAIQDENIDVLYLSPETLQARSDIKMLIGDRNIGVVIVDEAHIVTTWGKSFRADYWYLGIYLAKLRKKYKFPIVTFTATAIYGGREDMYLDTRNSLNMINPISYFGYVRRDNILMNVRSSEKDFDKEGRDYRKTKNTLALMHLQRAMKQRQKSLLYFPTIKLLSDFYNFVEQNEPEIAKLTGKYYGSLSKEEKDEVLSKFKSGELRFVLATKAFGMGIDISNITNVYHYAPTGSVVDYIQEIGRAARDEAEVPYGFGMIDFLSKDMNEARRLQGMSAIRKNQILEVMQKILSVYKEKHNRNLIISSEDFKYIFVQNKKDEDALDNKVKTVFLMIEKDFSSPNKLGYSPFVARPRSLFGNDLIFVDEKLEQQFIKSRLGSFFSKETSIVGAKYSAIYKINLSGIWEKYYKKMSFPNFKFALFNQEERKKLVHKNIFEKLSFVTGVEVSLNSNYTISNALSKYKRVLVSFEEFANEQKLMESQFTISDLGNHFMKSLKIANMFEARTFAQTIVNSAFEFSKIKNTKFISERSNSSTDNTRYILHQDGKIFTDFIMVTINETLKPQSNFINEQNKITSFHLRSKNSDKTDAKIAALGIGEAISLLSYQVLGGNNPQIYLRINSVYPLERAIQQNNFYQNSILHDVQIKHRTSVEMLKYLFTKEQPERAAKPRILNYSKWFWDNIENYFMGVLPTEVKNNIER